MIMVKAVSWLFCNLGRRSLYTAIFISEVVRAGIMAVAKGQSEAGLSLGF